MNDPKEDVDKFRVSLPTTYPFHFPSPGFHFPPSWKVKEERSISPFCINTESGIKGIKCVCFHTVITISTPFVHLVLHFAFHLFRGFLFRVRAIEERNYLSSGRRGKREIGSRNLLSGNRRKRKSIFFSFVSNLSVEEQFRTRIFIWDSQAI